jgi:hypothetical protein
MSISPLVDIFLERKIELGFTKATLEARFIGSELVDS